MLKLYYGGSEVPGWRTMLAESGVEHVALSYMGLRRRVKFVRPWQIADKYPAHQKVFLDSGAFTVNSKPDAYTIDGLKDISTHYLSFVTANASDVEMVSEFDAAALGQDWIEQMRGELRQVVPWEKLMVIWHPERGLEELYRMAETYHRVGIPRTAVGGRDLVPTLNSIAATYSVRLHGVAMTKPDVMRDVKFDTVSSTSWLSPSQYGDTQIWTGNELVRYPKKYKEKARKRHRTQISEAGFDADAIAADDPKEVLRLAVWSWERTVEDINRHRGEEIVSASPDPVSGGNTESGEARVDTSPPERRIVRSRHPAERRTLPVMGVETTTEVFVDTDGVNRERDITVIRSRSDSMRVCDSCFLASKCPAYEPETNCAYDIPIEVRTTDQMRALRKAIIEMQTARVLFMRMVEDMSGGYVDGNLSTEIDRLNRLIKQDNEMDQQGFSLKIEARQSGEMGMISRLFGREAGESARALQAPIPADAVLAQMGVIDAEIVSDPKAA